MIHLWTQHPIHKNCEYCRACKIIYKAERRNDPCAKADALVEELSAIRSMQVAADMICPETELDVLIPSMEIIERRLTALERALDLPTQRTVLRELRDKIARLKTIQADQQAGR